MKVREFHYIKNASASTITGDDKEVEYSYKFDYSSHQIKSRDVFEDEVVLVAYPIEEMQHIDTILRHFGLNDNSYYFYQQVKDLVALPEKHQNEKGEGKIDFQTFFKNVPYSFMSINNKAIVVIALHPLERTTKDGLKDYNMIGYIHANQFDYKPGNGETHHCYYYNMLRIADKLVNGENIYRRKKLFTMLFSVYNEICFLNNVTFAYASMGRENVAINDALHKCATDAGIHYERLQYKIFGQINMIWGSKSSSKKIVEISKNKSLLKKYYAWLRKDKSSMLFFQPETEEEFYNWIHKITAYSTSSGVYAIIENDEIKAATLAVNWSDYFLMLVLNPKGIFQLVERFKIIQRILFPVLIVGEPKIVKQLLKGLAYKYNHEHGCKVTFLPSYKGDPYFKVKKGLLDDNFYYFVITRDKDKLEAYKEQSKDKQGNVRPFVEMPMT